MMDEQFLFVVRAVLDFFNHIVEGDFICDLFGKKWQDVPRIESLCITEFEWMSRQ